MKQSEYFKLKKDLEKKLEALEVVWKLSQENGIADQSFKKGAITTAVKEAVNTANDSFDVTDIETLIKNLSPNLQVSKLQISTVLKRMEGKEEIFRVKKGQGRAPTQYSKLFSPQEEENGLVLQEQPPF